MGLQSGSIRVLARSKGKWTTEWDIGSIDKDPRLSDDWFCQEHYEQRFMKLLQSALHKANSPSFDIPGATLRWGLAKGMRNELAVELANNVLALWHQILTDWEAHPA